MNDKEKLKKLHNGCGHPQCPGWDCNPGHLCPDCWGKIAILKALIKYKKKVRTALNSRHEEEPGGQDGPYHNGIRREHRELTYNYKPDDRCAICRILQELEL